MGKFKLYVGISVASLLSAVGIYKALSYLPVYQPQTIRVEKKQKTLEKKLEINKNKTIEQKINNFANEQDSNDKYLFDSNDKYLYETLVRHEGKRRWVYDDKTGERLYPGEKAKGNRTIGVGCNLEKRRARQLIAKLGLDYDKVYNGEIPLNEEQIKFLFKEDLKIAKSDARKFIGEKNFDKLDKTAQNIVINMAFNMGYTRLSTFKKFKRALINHDYKTAADEMVNSKWYKQTRSRARELVAQMRKLADKTP